MARPRCAQHLNSRVWFDGTYGIPGRKRQRFKCVQPDGSRHVFTLPMPRLLAGEHGHECLDCERVAPKHEGPQLARRFDYTTREIAAALVDVGHGLSYRVAGRNVRLRGQNPLLANVNREANLVADWVEVFAPVVFAEHAPTEWPEVIVIDEVPFSKLTGTKKGKPIYAILSATGYYSGKPRLLRLEAFPSASKAAWVNFFAGLAGAPKRIVCDQSNAILAAIPTAWPKPLIPEITLCHYHLKEQAKRLIPAKMADLRKALEDAFYSTHSWDYFENIYARPAPLPKLHGWLDRKGPLIRHQIARRRFPRSVGALEETLRTIRKLLDDRRTNFRNRERLNRLLLLVQLEQLGLRNEARYARAIRAHLEANGGVANDRRLILDPKGQPCSLWLP